MIYSHFTTNILSAPSYRHILHKVDTFLQFFRAYYDSRGYLVYNLSTIRKAYIRSGWFFFNLLSSIPTSLLVWLHAATDPAELTLEEEGSSPWDHALMILDLFKLLRLFRLKRLMSTSSVVDSYWERVNVMTTSEFFGCRVRVVVFDIELLFIPVCLNPYVYQFYKHTVVLRFLVMISLLSVSSPQSMQQLPLSTQSVHLNPTRKILSTNSTGSPASGDA